MNTVYHTPIQITPVDRGSAFLCSTFVISRNEKKSFLIDVRESTNREAITSITRLISNNGQHDLVELPVQQKSIYLCGPVSGLPDLNRDAFYSKERLLNKLGHSVINPHEICKDIQDQDWQLCMRACIRELMHAETIVLLDGWEASKGANIERNLGLSLGIPSESFDDFWQSHFTA